MKAKYFFFLIIIGFFSACLDSENTFEFEESNEISFDDCPFYGFWADTLWCGEQLIIEQLNLNSTTTGLLITASTATIALDTYPFRYREEFEIIVEEFNGIGTYSLIPTIESYWYDNYLSFNLLMYDVIGPSFHHGLGEDGYYGEVVITAYDELTKAIEGEVRGELINTGWCSNKAFTQMNLRGGRFKGVIRN